MKVMPKNATKYSRDEALTRSVAETNKDPHNRTKGARALTDADPSRGRSGLDGRITIESTVEWRFNCFFISTPVLSAFSPAPILLQLLKWSRSAALARTAAR
jgi:hypothetical protein